MKTQTVRAFTVFFVVLLLHTSLVSAQDQATSRSVVGQQQAAGAQVIINQIDTSAFPKVTIFALVAKDGVPLKGLSAADFRVREDEVDQAPLTVVPKLTPLNAVVALDTSGSMRQRMADAQTAAKSFIDMLNPEDKVQVLSFAREVKILSPGGDRPSAKAAIDATMARGDTALYDALYTSVAMLKDTAGRKVITLLSDGADDNGAGKQLSKHSVNDVLALAREVNVPIYTIGVGTEIDETTLRKVANETGGASLIAPQPQQLKALYAKIGEQLAGQYNIYYTSNLPGDGTEHRVQLKYGDATGTKGYKAPLLAQAKPESPPVTVTQAVTPPPAPPTTPEVKKVDILTTEYAELITAPNAMWEKLLVGGVDPQTGESENAVYGFKGDKTATFDTVRIFIGETTNSNIKTVELLVSARLPHGSVHIGGQGRNSEHPNGKDGRLARVQVHTGHGQISQMQNDRAWRFSWVRFDKVGDAGKSLQILGQVNPSTQAVTPPPAPPATPEVKKVDILTPEYAELITAPNEQWEKLLTGDFNRSTSESENAVYGFKGEKTATFDTVRIFIGETRNTNLKTLELLVGSDSPTGPFTSAGKVETQNIRMAKTGGWQEFKFAPVTAKYLKCKMTGHGASYVYVDKVGDAGKSLQILGQVNPSTQAVTPPPAPPATPEVKKVDILTPEYAELITAPNEQWEKLLTGDFNRSTSESENAVYGFKGEKTATFDTVRIFIGETRNTNLKTLELLVGSDSPTGPFTSAGKVETQNIRMAKTGGWQEFKFTPVTAKYLKCKMTGHGASYVYVDKVGDAGKSLQILGQVNP